VDSASLFVMDQPVMRNQFVTLGRLIGLML
jgi:hypothetical protein